MAETLTQYLRTMREALLEVADSPLEEVRTRSWRSAHFEGARHQFVLRFDGRSAGTAADRFTARLPQTRLEMPGYTVADVSVVSDDRGPGWARLRVEVLTVKS